MVYTEDIMTADDIIEMYDGDLELITVFKEHGKLEELRDYIEETYCNDYSHWYDYKVYDDLNGYAEEIKALFGVKE